MSARKNVNQSRPRALACGDALAVAGAVCFHVASVATPTSARRSSRPPSNSSANVDSPLSPAPSGNYGVGFWPNAPRIRPPSLTRIPHTRHAPEGVSECARRYSNMRNEAILRSVVSSTKIAAMEQSSKIPEPLREKGSAAPTARSTLLLVSEWRAQRATRVHGTRRPWNACSRPRWLTPSLNPPRAWMCAQLTCARGSRRWP
jgi:hypothetical protein